MDIVRYINQLNKNNNKANRIKLKKINMYIELLSQYGFSLSEPYIKKINKDIWELRPLKDRIFFASCFENKFILLTIFIKKTQRTPKSEIEKAQRLLEDYRRRGHNSEAL